MIQLVFLLEELSAKEMLDNFLPRILPKHISFKTIPFEGKQDLEKQLLKKLRGWNNPNARFIVLRDQDSGECKVVKSTLLNICSQSNKEVLVRIACHELESWYLGDLRAIEIGLGIANISKYQNKAKYRDPDLLSNAFDELKKIAPSYQKVSGSRMIGRYIDPKNNKSKSFNMFVSGISKLTGDLQL